MPEKIESYPSSLTASTNGFSSIYYFWVALRPHQWAKNLLLFAPVFLGHRYGEPLVWLDAIFGFCLFSLAASTIYLFNDLLDVEQDRKHRTKKHRPIASGKLSLNGANFGVAVLLAVVMVGSLWTTEAFRGLLVVYFTLNLLYTRRLKRVFFLDVLILASFYTIRLFAGGAVTEIPISHWLTGFSTFLFLSLAILKRYIEVDQLATNTEVAGRSYRASDKFPLFVLGCVSGYMSTVVLALYTFSEKTPTLYRAPELLWGLNFVLLYWVSVLFLRASRREVLEDPILFVVKDRLSLILGVTIATIMLVARFLP